LGSGMWGLAGWHRIHFSSIGSASGHEGSVYMVDPKQICIRVRNTDPQIQPQAPADPITQTATFLQTPHYFL